MAGCCGQHIPAHVVWALCPGVKQIQCAMLVLSMAVLYNIICLCKYHVLEEREDDLVSCISHLTRLKGGLVSPAEKIIMYSVLIVTLPLRILIILTARIVMHGCYLYNIIHFCEYHVLEERDDDLVSFIIHLTGLKGGFPGVGCLVWCIIMYSVLVIALPLRILIILTARMLLSVRKKTNKKRIMETFPRYKGSISVILITIIIMFIICQLLARS